MKIFILQEKKLSGGYIKNHILIKNPSILVSNLKEEITKKFQIDPSFQRLKYEIGEEFMVLLTESFSLEFFHIKEDSCIFLETLNGVQIPAERISISNQKKTENTYIKSTMENSTLCSDVDMMKESLEDLIKSKSCEDVYKALMLNAEEIKFKKKEFEIFELILENILTNKPKEVIKNYIEYFINEQNMLSIKNNQEQNILHILIIKNNISIINLLIEINININDLIFSKDLYNKSPIDYCSCNEIIKVFKSAVNSKNIENYIHSLPQNPMTTVGFLEKKGKSGLIYNLRFFELDPINGCFKRFENFEKYPFQPTEVNIIGNITQIVKKSNGFVLTIEENKKTLVYSFKSSSSEYADMWISRIKLSISYYKELGKIIKIEPQVFEIISVNKMEKIYIPFKKHEDEVYYNDYVKLHNQAQTIIGRSSEMTQGNSSKKRRENQSFFLKKIEQPVLLDEDSTEKYGINLDSFEVTDLLGSGAFGKVYKGKLKSDSKLYAIKILNKDFLIKNNQLRYAINECNILRKINHPYIVKLYYSFMDEKNLYMVLDFCSGGDLSYHISKMLFEEDEILFFISELILALNHLHSLGIIHRDLKPENILINSDGHIKLTDFGLVKDNIKNTNKAMSMVGTGPYLSPEMIKEEGVNKACDLYALGIIIYEMITGRPPFISDNKFSLFENILQGKFDLDSSISDELRSLILVRVI